MIGATEGPSGVFLTITRQVTQALKTAANRKAPNKNAAIVQRMIYSPVFIFQNRLLDKRQVKTQPLALFMLDKIPMIKLVKGKAQFRLGVHHDGAVPGNRFSDGLARYKQEP